MERSGQESTHFGVKRILLAEDVELNQYLAKHFLEARGLEVSIANNGFEALALLETNIFDCILMDIQMPEMDGIQAACQIRKLSDPIKSSIPIIALTANVHQDDIAKYMAAGMNDFLAKPFDELSLFDIITKNQSSEHMSAQSGASQASNGHDRLYDLSIVQSVSGGDPAFIRKMILLFMETVPANVAELVQALRTENWDQVGKLAHKLKSTVDSMGIKSIHGDIRRIEMNAKQKSDLDALPSLVSKVETTIACCIEQLKEEIL